MTINRSSLEFKWNYWT